MPTSTPRSAARKTAKPKQRTTNALLAEAQPNQFDVATTWRGHEVSINLADASFGRIAYAARTAANEKAPLYNRVNAMIDVFEGVLGEDQTASIIQAEPRLLDDPALMTEFWEVLNKAITGAKPGESTAS
jgi:hypothetical protein